MTFDEGSDPSGSFTFAHATTSMLRSEPAGAGTGQRVKLMRYPVWLVGHGRAGEACRVS
mgnify:CR=1 FL=1|jgi:hypothetical protein